MTDSRRTIRKLAVLVFALMLINIFSLGSVLLATNQTQSNSLKLLIMDQFPLNTWENLK